MTIAEPSCPQVELAPSAPERCCAGIVLPMSGMHGQPRFLTLADVAEVLNTSQAQVYALVRRGELRAIKIGGRGQWRVETTELEAFIERMYAQTEAETRAGSATVQRGQVPDSEQVDGPTLP